MPNRDVHGPVGAVSGGAYALYMSSGQSPWHVAAETAGGAVGGYAGGILPDVIDTPEHPHHRGFFHPGVATRYLEGWADAAPICKVDRSSGMSYHGRDN